MGLFITVVMPVRNEANYIRDTLQMVLGQDYPPDRYEIIVADGMSDDGTQEIVREISVEHPQVRLLPNPKRLSSAGRNIGFRKGRGDLFLVIDGHCYIDNDQLLKSVGELFEETGADCLGRPQPLDPPGLTPFQEAVAMARASRIGRSGCSLIYSDYEGEASPVSNGAAYRREVFQKVGYVDESFDACEDVEFNYRIKEAELSAYTSPRLRVRYYPRATLEGLFRQMARYGRGRFQLQAKHWGSFSMESVVPPSFVIAMLLLYVTGLGILQAVFSLYIGLILISSLQLSGKAGWRYLLYLPIIYYTIHLGLGWGYLNSALERTMSVVRAPFREAQEAQ